MRPSRRWPGPTFGTLPQEREARRSSGAGEPAAPRRGSPPPRRFRSSRRPIPEIPPAESEATSWFNRDAATPPAPGPEAPANPDSGPVEAWAARRVRGRPSDQPAESGSPTAAETSTRSEARARSETSARPAPPAPNPQVRDGQVRSGQGRVRPARDSRRSGTAEISESADPECFRVRVRQARDRPAPAAEGPDREPGLRETASAKRQEAPEASSTVKQEAPAVLRVRGTGGRCRRTCGAGRDRTRARRAAGSGRLHLGGVRGGHARRGRGAACSEGSGKGLPSGTRRRRTPPPAVIPVIREQPRAGGPGDGPTRSGKRSRSSSAPAAFTTPTCPLIKGMGGSGVETMSRSEAEEAGLSSCPVCLGDH